MKSNRIFLILTACLLFMLSGCAGYRTTQFKYGTLKIGADKAEILERYGAPFRADVIEENESSNGMFRYKEPVDVGSCTYIMTTDLYLVNSKLVKVEQNESDPPCSNVVVEKG